MNRDLRNFHCYQINNEGLTSLWGIFTASCGPGDKFLVKCCPAVAAELRHHTLSISVCLQKAALELSWNMQDRYSFFFGETALSWDTFFNLRAGQRMHCLKGASQGILQMGRRNSPCWKLRYRFRSNPPWEYWAVLPHTVSWSAVIIPAHRKGNLICLSIESFSFPMFHTESFHLLVQYILYCLEIKQQTFSKWHLDPPLQIFSCG